MAHYKMGIYGEPAVGKSVFSLGWPDPFFICTDENYEYLKPFGAKEENHVQVTSWEEFKNLVKTKKFDGHETIVIDLLEDLYQWADAEYCKRNKIDDLGDLGYGKGYKIVRNDFTYYILKIINLPKNVILLSHQESSQDKTNRGVTYTSYNPSSFIPKKCWEMIDGKLRFFFRAHMEEEQNGEEVVKRRLLSIRPKAHEFQINRGLDVDSLPDDIDLSYDAFVELFGKPSDFGEIKIKQTENVTPAVEKTEPVASAESPVTQITSATEPAKVSPKKVQSPKKEKSIETSTEDRIKAIKEKLAKSSESVSEPVSEPVSASVSEPAPKVTEDIQEQPVKSEEPKPQAEPNKNDVAARIAAIKAKLAKQKTNQ